MSSQTFWGYRRGPQGPPTPAELQGEVDRHSWLDLAGVLLLLVGVLNIIDGIAAISDAKYLSSHVLFSNLHAWGWFFLIFGIIQILAGFAIFGGATWGAILGIVTAFFNIIAQLAWAHTYPVWAIAAMVVDALVIYGLVVYGGQRTT